MAFHYPDDVPVLTDGVVVLRAYGEPDLDAIVEQCRDPDMVRYTTVPRPYSRGDAHEFLSRTARNWQAAEPASTRTWAITATASDGHFCGGIDYRPSGSGSASIGFSLHPAARGHGLMQRAAGLVLDHAFAHDIDVMHWSAVIGNWASRKTVWHLGFRYDGIVADHIHQPDGTRDAWTASLHRDDPRSPCEPWPTA